MPEQFNMFDKLDQLHFLDLEAGRAKEYTHMGRCQRCRKVIGAYSKREWSKKARQPCPYCGVKRW